MKNVVLLFLRKKRDKRIMTIDDGTLRKGYLYILRHPIGYLSELDEIDNRLASYFASAGIIAYGITSRAKLRYKVTPDGERIARVDYTSLTLKLFREKNNSTQNALVRGDVFVQ